VTAVKVRDRISVRLSAALFLGLPHCGLFQDTVHTL